jgi:hypothetical protein
VLDKLPVTVVLHDERLQKAHFKQQCFTHIVRYEKGICHAATDSVVQLLCMPCRTAAAAYHGNKDIIN